MRRITGCRAAFRPDRMAQTQGWFIESNHNAGICHDKSCPRDGLFSRGPRWLRIAVGLIAVLCLFAGTRRAVGAPSAFPENQVKALLLLNFAKYVDWPSDAFTDTNMPIGIAVVGNSGISDDLKKVVEGKNVGGRAIVIKKIATDAELAQCHILFITAAEKSHVAVILSKINARPVLTVGETGRFMEQGGIINFVKKDDQIRLEINLDAARQAKVRISSKLLSVADVVKGKSN